MTYAVKIYVSASGNIYSARDTDQRGTNAEQRTVGGMPVVYAGTWYGSQMSYRPFKAACEAAAKHAAELLANA
jgi:hypothetical protein